MKRFLNGLGVFGSVILTFILTGLIFSYMVVLNIKLVVSENVMSNTFKKIDIVESLKSSEDETMWEDFVQLGESLNLSEQQFEQILNSDKVKEQVGSYIGEVLSSTLNDKEVNLTKEEMEKFLNIAVDEYNKVSDKKISDSERKKIVNLFDEKMISNLNEELGSINLSEMVEPEYVRYIELADNLLFGNYTLIMLFLIIFIIGLIALFRFSWYKWIPYFNTSAITSGILMLLIGLIISIIPLREMEIITPIRNLLVTRMFITSAILFALAIGLSIAKKYLKKYTDKKKSNAPLEETNEDKEIKEEIKEVEEKKDKKRKIDKKTIIIIVLILILLLIVLFLIFGRKGSYTITFDANGGTEISSIEVKNNEIVTLPEAPKKNGYKFVGWTNEDGKIITEGTKVTEDLTLTAEWISNKAKTVTTKFDTDGGNVIDNIVIEKGDNILLPVNPTREGYIFVGWLDKDGKIVNKNIKVSSNITLKAQWIKKGIKTSTIKFNTDGGTNVENIIVEKGKLIMLPTNPTKEGYAFAGWVDENGNAITEGTIVNKNMTIKATWKQPYDCPSDCTPIGDGSKCTKTTTKDLVVYSGCPTGTETIEKFCSSHKKQISIGFGEDQFYETVGIMCDNNPKGFCVDYKGRYTIASDSCPSGYYKYTEIEGLGAAYGCAKKYDKGGSGCPSGYTKNGNKCTKTETISCKAN